MMSLWWPLDQVPVPRETVPIGGVGGLFGRTRGGGCHRTRGWAGCAPPRPGRNRGGFVRRGGIVENKGGGCSLGGVARNNKGGVLLGKGGGCKEQKEGVLWGGLCMHGQTAVEPPDTTCHQGQVAIEAVGLVGGP